MTIALVVLRLARSHGGTVGSTSKGPVSLGVGPVVLVQGALPELGPYCGGYPTDVSNVRRVNDTSQTQLTASIPDRSAFG